MNITYVANALTALPTAWIDLPNEYRNTLYNAFVGEGGFSDEQLDLLRDWYLQVDSAKVALIERVLPKGTGVAVLQDKFGRSWISASLLTDCIHPTDTYYNIGNIVAAIPITKVDRSYFVFEED